MKESILQRVLSLSGTLIALSTMLFGQAPGIQLNTVYQCPAEMSFKVLACAGSQATDSCDVESYARGQLNQRGKSTRQQIMTLMQLCGAQSATPAQGNARGNATPQADVNGFKIGDAVKVSQPFGWIDGRIVAISGNNYRVRVTNDIEVTKTYPSELHRVGPLTEHDRAVGLFELHEKVQVLVDGKQEVGEVMTILGMDYQLRLPGNRTAWANGSILKLVPETPKPAAKAGVPPKPGLTSCAGKIEGRYASSGPFGATTIEFRSGKAILRGLTAGGDETVECWMGGGKIYLHKLGESADQDLPIDINNDGSLQTPFGEITKKGN